MERIIGDLGNDKSGKLLLAIGAIHGNETSGMIALEQVFEYLESMQVPIRGRFVAMRGNLKAIKAQKRYLERDLNRLWADDIVERALRHPEASPEFEELKDLFIAFEKLRFRNYPERFFLDLHTTSAENGTFTLVEDLGSTAYIVDHFHAPVVLGLYKGLLNTTIPYMHMHGFTAIGFEAGKIGTRQAIDNQMLTIFQALWLTGIIKKEDAPPHVLEYTDMLEQNAHLPPRMKLAYCHKITAEDEFKMKPGYKNFDPVAKGEVLAHDRNGEITAPTDGYMLMPLYQSQGNDGFFIVRNFHE